MDRSLRSLFPRAALAVLLVALLIAGLAAGASGLRVASTPAANVVAGEKVFTSVGCSACHTFRAAAATGKIGPSLDTVKLTAAQVILQVTKGGCAIMTKAACSKYKFSMTPFKSRLSKTQIADVAAFVYGERNHAPLPGTKTTTSSPAMTTTATTTTTAATTTAATTTTATTTTTAPPTTTTTAGGGGGDTLDGCPPGQTIMTAGGNDHDEDEGGAASDGDGCI